MELDVRAIDETVLALLYLTLHERNRAWKGHEWGGGSLTEACTGAIPGTVASRC